MKLRLFRRASSDLDDLYTGEWPDDLNDDEYEDLLRTRRKLVSPEKAEWRRRRAAGEHPRWFEDN